MKMTVMSMRAPTRADRQLGDPHVEHHGVPGHHLRHTANATRLGFAWVDVDAFVLAHRDTWDRLEQLVKNRRRLTGAEVDELVELYQRVSTHLSMLRSGSSDSALVGRLVGSGGACPGRGHRCPRPAVQ